MKKTPALTREQAESLVQGEEYRLLVRNGLPGFVEPGRKVLVERVAKASSFEEALEIILRASENE